MEYYWYRSLSCSTPLTLLHCSALHCTALPLSLAKIQQKLEGGEKKLLLCNGENQIEMGGNKYIKD